MAELFTDERIFERQSILSNFIERGSIGKEVLEQVILGGKGIGDESTLWDFKISLPVLPASKVSPSYSAQHDAKLHEIVKDCVAFYNSHGGYLITGVEDKSKSLVGFSLEFDAADLNKKIYGATNWSIETIFRSIKIDGAGPASCLGLLYIPKRPKNVKPIQFKKNAPQSENGSRAYSLNDFYMRDRDECRKAVTAEDFEYIFGSRDIDESQFRPNLLDHNLPPRDYDLGRLYGRDGELTQLWSWLADAFNPVKILCGLGGVGKTSIAYTFAERIVNSAPAYVNKLVWLGAKESSFAPLLGKEIQLARVDFSNIDEMLIALLQETGCPKEQIPQNPSRDELLSLCQTHLSAFSYVLVIDNVDTLEDDEQQQIFHTLMQLCAVSKSKVVITARRNLGASRLMYTEIEGLSYADFEKFVIEKCEHLKLGRPFLPGSRQMRDFYEASGGSPLFALSVLRLLGLGDSPKEAIAQWRGSDGETVRRAAFQLEVDRLDATESRVLLVLCYLSQATVPEISNILKLNRFQIHNALERLQAFSMINLDRSLPSGTVFKLPATLTLVSSLVERRVADAKKISQLCKEYIDLANNQGPYVADIISQAIAQIHIGDGPEALAITLTAMNTLPDNGDLQCLLGRVYSYIDDTRAEDAYQKASELGCQKRELFDGWIAFRQSKENWIGVISICNEAERKLRLARYGLVRHHAEMRIGDQLAQSGQYKEAEQLYDTAISNIRKTIHKYTDTLDNRAFKDMKDSIVVRWLGAVRMMPDKHGDALRRYIGATIKAIISYKVSNVNVYRYSTSAMFDLVERVSERQTVSQTAKDQLVSLRDRILEARPVVARRVDLPITVRTKFQEDTLRVVEKIAHVISE